MRGMRIASRPSLLILAFADRAQRLRSDAGGTGARITSPKEEFGFNFGDDYQLATYQQLAAYWQKLDRESDRMVLQEIGKTSEGRPHLMAIVTSPENHKNLARYQATSHAGSRSPRGSPTIRRARSRAKARPSSGSTAACTPARCSARSSSARWSTRW